MFVWLSLDVSKSTDRMANSVDPDQTAQDHWSSDFEIVKGTQS